MSSLTISPKIVAVRGLHIGAVGALLPAGSGCSLDVFGTEVVLELGESSKLSNPPCHWIDVSIPVNIDVPEFVGVGGIGGGALLELGNIDRIIDVGLGGQVLVVDHLELRELSQVSGAIADELVEKFVTLFVIEEHVGALIGELVGIVLSILSNTDMGSTGIPTVGRRSDTVDLADLACASRSIARGVDVRTDQWIRLGGRINDGRVSRLVGTLKWATVGPIFIDIWSIRSSNGIDTETPFSKIAAIVAADALANFHAGVRAVVGNLDALVLAINPGGA